ncbi:hypothetical protein A0128_16145 [Leptospira tipperaryensis]|uniref:Uncharacterized protein n=1 Tax=Leptospira tipperaryensis TaxID=2564040 RepID=A0A1D7V075_9LEPT|nr:hypothetical protein [Leptospira tipperaryensis]AOP35236.1 hypothetical protein A0128_16145 [Leptospira tipperaryensis]
MAKKKVSSRRFGFFFFQDFPVLLCADFPQALAGENSIFSKSRDSLFLRSTANLSLTNGKKIEFGLGNSSIYDQDPFLDFNPNYVYNDNKKSQVNAPAPYIALKLPVTDKVSTNGRESIFRGRSSS